MNQQYLEAINLLGFAINLINLQENLTQNDKSEIIQNLSNSTDKLLKEIHAHLERQDEKIDKILEILSDNGLAAQSSRGD